MAKQEAMNSPRPWEVWRNPFPQRCVVTGFRSGVERAARRAASGKFNVIWPELAQETEALYNYRRNLVTTGLAIIMGPKTDTVAREMLATCRGMELPAIVVTSRTSVEEVQRLLKERLRKGLCRVFVTGPEEQDVPGIETWAEVFLARAWEKL